MKSEERVRRYLSLLENQKYEDGLTEERINQIDGEIKALEWVLDP